MEIITCCNDEVQERWENVISNKRSNLGEVVDSFVAGTRFLTTNERHSHEKRPFAGTVIEVKCVFPFIDKDSAMERRPSSTNLYTPFPSNIIDGTRNMSKLVFSDLKQSRQEF